MTRPVWSDEFTGPRWTYGLSYRPLVGGVPQGWLIQSNQAHPDFRHGTVQYPRQLTPAEVAGFELTEVAG